LIAESIIDPTNDTSKARVRDFGQVVSERTGLFWRQRLSILVNGELEYCFQRSFRIDWFDRDRRVRCARGRAWAGETLAYSFPRHRQDRSNRRFCVELADPRYLPLAVVFFPIVFHLPLL
jgi:hypothetical protein